MKVCQDVQAGNVPSLEGQDVVYLVPRRALLVERGDSCEVCPGGGSTELGELVSADGGSTATRVLGTPPFVGGGSSKGVFVAVSFRPSAFAGLAVGCQTVTPGAVAVELREGLFEPAGAAALGVHGRYFSTPGRGWQVVGASPDRPLRSSVNESHTVKKR